MPRHRKRKKSSICKVNKIEHTVSTILQNLNIPFEREVQVGKYTVDFLVGGKYIIECYGDYWHCNPLQYTSSYYNKGKKKFAHEIWQRDMERQLTFEQLDYRFIHLWESEIKHNHKAIREKIKRFTKK
jgi:very-short-patch-repair endonuclease